MSTYYCWVIYLPHEILPIRILDTLLCQERLCSLDLSQDPEQLHQPLVAPTSDISPFTCNVQDPLDLLLKTSEYRREEECFSRSLYFCVCFCVNFCILFVGVFLVQEFGHFDPLEVLIYLRYWFWDLSYCTCLNRVLWECEKCAARPRHLLDIHEVTDTVVYLLSSTSLHLCYYFGVLLFHL